jgi:hypothetical protein
VWELLRLKSKRECVRFEVFTAVTMKNGVFWDVTPFFKRECVRFEVFTAVTMKNGVFWDVTPFFTRECGFGFW